MNKELLSPAGDFETLKQAIHNGCDAVYLGGKKYGARKFASNFTEEEMIKAIRYCHLFGVKIYVTVNTVIFDNEVDACLDYLTFLHKNGVDAVIMQDIGMITLVRKVLPNLDIHVSTQAHTHNVEQIKLLEKLGVKRVVVAREISIDDINKLDTKLEIEAFIHGALCICYSGQCLFSSLLLSRSGNRGECAGICRLPFTLLENDNEVKCPFKYLLSPKELNTTSHIKELLSSKITSFKIEGRMKSPTTIGFITRLYRNLIDHYLHGEEISLTSEEQEKLLVLFNREYTSGYLFNNSNIMNIKSPNHVGIKIGKVIGFNDKYIKIKLDSNLNQGDGIRFYESKLGMNVNFLYDSKNNLISGSENNSVVYVDNKINLTNLDTVYKTVDNKLLKELENYEERKIAVNIEGIISGSNFYLSISDGINKVDGSLDIVLEASGNGTSKDRIISQLMKTGNTVFKVDKINLNIDKDNIFIPISKINELRRDLLLKLDDKRSSSHNEVIINKNSEIIKKEYSNNIKISALVRTEKQLITCLNENIDYIYVTDIDVYNKYKNDSRVYLRLSRVNNSYNNLDNCRLLVGEIGSINRYSNNNYLVSDYYLNVTNGYYVDYLRKLGINRITLSIENSIDTMSNIINRVGNNGLEVIVYGRLEAMIIKNNIVSNIVSFNSNNKYSLKDRNGAIYPITFDNNFTHIFYYKNYELLDKISELRKMGIVNYRFEFLDESDKEIVNIIKKYKTILLDR